jgi:hypothetical protein
VLTHYQKSSFPCVDLREGDRKYPFARPGQIFDFGVETTESLLNNCRFLHEHFNSSRAN